MSDIGFEQLFDSGSFDKGTKQLAKYIERITDEITKAEIALEDLAKVFGKQLKNEINKLNSSSKNLSKEMGEVSQKMNQFKQTTTQTKGAISKYEKENEKLRLELQKLKTAQTNVTNTTKKASMSFKDGAQAMLGLASGAALIYTGVQKLREQLTLAIKSTIDFEQAMKEVQAISRGSAKQLEALTANANKLGSSTEKTALQIAGLQKELAKLGFTTTEILGPSQAIVDLSTATGEDLAESARVVAATLRAFNLEAVETKRVVDVMAGSFVRSGLDLSKFAESMKLVAPIAEAVNIDVETTTAALSKLADAGLSGSLAGTALRNLFSELADPTSELAEFLGYTVTSSEQLIVAFEDLRDRGVDLAQAVQMVDVRARPAFFTLLNQVDAVKELSKEYKSLTGESQKITATMRDTLKNDLEIANSAFDALRRNLMEGSIPAMRSATQAITQLIEALRLFASGDLQAENPILRYLIWIGENHMDNLEGLADAIASIGSVLGNLGGSISNDIFNSAEAKRVEELFESAKSSVELFGEAADKLSLAPLVEEYRELQKVVNPTIAQKQRMIAISTQFSMAFGESAVMVDKETKSLSVNLAGIERLIKAKGEEAIATKKSIQARIEEIDAILLLNGAETKTAKLTKTFSEVLEIETGNLTENNKLIQEKTILLESLQHALPDVIDETANGWSVLTEAGKKGLEELKKKLEEAAEALAIAQKAAFMNAWDEYMMVFDLEEKALEQKAKDKVKRAKDIQEKSTDIYEQGLVEELDAGKEADKIFEQRREEQQAEWDKERKEELDKEKEQWKQKEQIARLAAQALSRITTFIFDGRQIARDNELRAIEKWEEEKLRLAGDNEQSKIRIREEAARREAEIRNKQARDNKKEAIFQIIIDTAQAVMATLANGAGFFSTPLAMIVAGLGAAQIATVMAQPLPQFAKGTDDSPEGLAEVGERGRELVRDGKTGKWSLTPDKSTITYLTKHSQVITNAETERILSQDHNSRADTYLSNIPRQPTQPSFDYNKMGEIMDNAVSKIPSNITNFDQNGVTKYVVNRSAKIKRLNKRY